MADPASKECSKCLTFLVCTEPGRPGPRRTPVSHLPDGALCSMCQDQAKSDSWTPLISQWGGPAFPQGLRC